MSVGVSAEKSRMVSALLVTAGMIFTVGSALGFQHIGGYTPCALCLLQRDPYYYAIPIGVLAILASIFKLPAALTRVLLVVIGIAMLIGLGLGVYHSGVEWGFWPGPTTCATGAPSITTNAGNLLNDLNAIKARPATRQRCVFWALICGLERDRKRSACRHRVLGCEP